MGPRFFRGPVDLRIGVIAKKLKFEFLRAPRDLFAMLGPSEEVRLDLMGSLRCRVRPGWRAVLVALWILGALSAPGQAEPRPAESQPSVGLGQLLHLPEGYAATAKPQGPRGTADEWRLRYAAADREIRESQAELQRLQGQLEQQAGKSTSWNLAAPGMSASSPEDVPMNFSLSQQIRIQKEKIEDQRRKRKMLDVEADLAGVPGDWRTDSKAALRPGAPKATER